MAAGRAEELALVHDSAMTGEVTRFTYAELTAEVARLAEELAERGVGKGDRVLVYLPTIPQAPIAMLTCARLGAVRSVVFGGFVPRELAARIDDATPDVVLTCTGGIEPKRRVEYLPAVAEALEIAEHPVRTVLVHHRDGFATAREDVAGRGGAEWEDWAEAVAGATTVLYEGKPVGTPDAGAFWRLIEDHGVRSFFTAPTALRAVRKADPEAALLAEHDVWCSTASASPWPRGRRAPSRSASRCRPAPSPPSGRRTSATSTRT